MEANFTGSIFSYMGGASVPIVDRFAPSVEPAVNLFSGFGSVPEWFSYLPSAENPLPRNSLIAANPPWIDPSNSWVKAVIGAGAVVLASKIWPRVQESLQEIRLRIIKLQAIFIAGICKLLCGDYIKAEYIRQKERACVVFRDHDRYRDKVKPLNKPLQLVPHSLHPIDSTSW